MPILEGLLPTQTDLTIYRGDTYDQLFSFTWNDDDVDLANATATLVIKDNLGNIIQTLTAGSGLTVNASADTIAMQLTSVETTALSQTPTKQYYWDLKLDFGADGIKTPLKGCITVLEDIA